MMTFLTHFGCFVLGILATLAFALCKMSALCDEGMPIEPEAPKYGAWEMYHRGANPREVSAAGDKP
jgi:hypothetical protein